MEIVAVNVGYGDAVLLKKDGYTFLIDCGSDIDSDFENDKYRIKLADFLIKSEINYLDALFISHIHEDHVGGLKRLIENCKIAHIYTPYSLKIFEGKETLATEDIYDSSTLNYTKALNTYINTIKYALDNDIKITVMKKGDFIEFSDDFTLDVLLPDENILSKYENLLHNLFEQENKEKIKEILNKLDGLSNATSALLKFNSNAGGYLSTGDSCPKYWTGIDKSIFSNIKILKLPHHGQIDSFNEDIMKNIPLEYLITTASSDRKFNSANREVYQKFSSIRIGQKLKFLFTDIRDYSPFFTTDKDYNAIKITYKIDTQQVEYIKVK